MAETNGLLNRHTGITGIEGSNPSVSAIPPFAGVHHSPKNTGNHLKIKSFQSLAFAVVRGGPEIGVGLSVGR